MGEETSQPSMTLELKAAHHYIIAVAVFGLLLITSTWKLWIPVSTFPQVPLINGMGNFPQWVDYGLLTGILIALLLVVASAFKKRNDQVLPAGWLMFVICMTATMLLNQHRIQTWSFQFLVIAILYLTIIPQRRLLAFQAFLFCVYICSATSKLDISFINEQGIWLVEGLMKSIGLSTKFWSKTTLQTMAFLMPVSELVVATLLLITRLGKWRILPAIIMHILLIFTFSPWGHDQNHSVLLWNIFFIAQVIILFGSQTASTSKKVSEAKRVFSRKHLLGKYLLISLMILPAFERLGWFDTWTSWAVYAGHPEEVFIEVNEAAVQKLSPELMKLAQKIHHPQEEYYRLRIDRWSLQEVNAPIYPESRFRVGVALYLAKRYHLKDGIRIRFRSTADRFSGERTEIIYQGTKEINQFTNQFSLNSHPRD